MTRSRMRQHTCVGLWATAVVAVACGSPSTAVTARSAGSPSSTSVTTEATGALRVGDADNEGSAIVTVGQSIVVTLASTYWTIAAASDVRVLEQDARPTVTPGGPSCPSIPGSGCGKVVAAFTALAPGQAELSADRTSCGEALRCSSSQATWRFRVQVATPTPGVPIRPATTAAVAPSTVVTSTTTSTIVQPRSGVMGTVVFSPVCPVERVPPDPQCAPRPGAAQVQLVRADSGGVLTGLAGADGHFSIPVEPGTYAVKAASAPSPGRGCSADPAQVTVAPGSIASVSVTCDTGIR